MIVDCISDLHGHYPYMQGGDLLLIAGDLTADDSIGGYIEFRSWLENVDYRMKIFIAGNHDNRLEREAYREERQDASPIYLKDTGIDFEGFKIWGSPWTRTFIGQNPHAKAFAVDTEEELAEKWALIPKDVDILVTHSPPEGILDGTTWPKHRHVGSRTLYELMYAGRIAPKLHVFGHIHESYGMVPKLLDFPSTTCVNASHVNRSYEPVNPPRRIIL